MKNITSVLADKGEYVKQKVKIDYSQKFMEQH